ncbi:MAG: O-antigen ligase family protein [Deltaproteobacteria bacterium]|nr:O-antigen ligase family protein [Deltaproteobacteria bacterium]
MNNLEKRTGHKRSGVVDEAGGAGPGAIFNHVIEKGISFLLIFTPLAFGTVQPWSVAVMEAAAFIVFGAWLIRMSVLKRAEFYITPVLFFMLMLAVVAVIQITPMPPGLLSVISPSSARIYSAFSNEGASAWRAISIAPQSTLDELWKLLSYIAVFTVVINHFKRRAQVFKVLRLVVWLGLGIAVFAVVQKMAWNGRIYWIYPVREGLSSGSSYIWGPYINRNHFAGYMEMAVPLALGLFLYRITEIKTLPGVPFRKKLIVYANSKALMPMAVLLAAALVMSGVLFMTLSRGGTAGLVAGVAVFLALSLKRRSLKNKAVIMAAIAVVLLLFVLSFSWSRLEERFSEVSEEGRTARFGVWADSLNLAGDFPVLGAGLGAFEKVYPAYQTLHPIFIYIHAENDFVEILTDTGLVGAATAGGVILFFFYPVVQGWRARRNSFVKCMAAAGTASCGALFVHSFTDFNMRIPANAMLITVIAGVTYAMVFNVSERDGRHAAKKI